MTGVVVYVDVVDLLLRRGEVVEGLVGGDVLDRNHVDGADKVALPVVSQERAGGQSRRIHVQRAEPGEEVRERHERADLFVVARWRCHLLRHGRRASDRGENGEGQTDAYEAT